MKKNVHCLRKTKFLIIFSFLLPILFVENGKCADDLQNFILLKDQAGKIESVQIRSPLHVDLKKIAEHFFAIQSFRDEKTDEKTAEKKQERQLLSWEEFEKSLAADGRQAQGIDAKTITTLKTAFDFLQKTDLRKLKQDPEFNKAVKTMNLKLLNFTQEWQTVAHLQNHRFFRNSHLKNDLLSWAMDFASSELASVPGASFLLALFKNALENLEIRRGFYQNMLMQKLAHHSPADLNLQLDDYKSMMSSFYESQIQFGQVDENEAVDKDWSAYGENKLRSQINQAGQAMIDYEWSQFPRMSFNFCELNDGSTHLIKSLMVKKFAFASQMTTSYSYNDETAALKFRFTAEALVITLDILPLPALSAAVPQWFLRSYYVDQIKNEGGLMGLFMEKQNTHEMSVLLQQSVNVFLISDSF